MGDVEHPEYGTVSPLVLFAFDQLHLTSIQSPFAVVLQQHLSLAAPPQGNEYLQRSASHKHKEIAPI